MCINFFLEPGLRATSTHKQETTAGSFCYFFTDLCLITQPFRTYLFDVKFLTGSDLHFVKNLH